MNAHPLDRVLSEAGTGTPCYAAGLSGLTQAVAAVTDRTLDRRQALVEVTATVIAILELLGIEEPVDALRQEYDLAVLRHPGMTLDCERPTYVERLAAVVEELGEVARALTYDRDHAGDLTKELAQLGALTAAWATRYKGRRRAR